MSRNTHAEYNRFIQKVQEESRSWGFETRTSYDGSRARFEVYFDGRWNVLGSETPFVRTDAEREPYFDPDLWIKIQAAAAVAIGR